jgi:acetyltransferase-like isoleucine patch superfamily enzyme
MDAREVAAVFAAKKNPPDPEWERGFAGSLRDSYSRDQLMELFGRFRCGEGAFDYLMRRILMRALCKSVGNHLQVGPNVALKHPESMEFGDGVFIGAQAMIQGRFDGAFRVGSHVWIGPQAYFDARALVIEDYVGWGPGAKVLGSTHSGQPEDAPIIATPLKIDPVVIGFGADVGTNATILPGAHIGAHSVIGAGAVVNCDIPERAIAAGVPARVLRFRHSHPA